MSKPFIKSIRSAYDQERIKENFDEVATYIEDNLLHRDGEDTPSPLEQDVDANGKQVKNLRYATDLDDAIPLQQAQELLSGDFSSLNT